MNLVRQDQRFFSSISSTWEPDSASFQPFLSSTFSDKNDRLFSVNKQTFQFGTFSHQNSNRASSNCLSLNNPARGCPDKFRSKSTTRSSMLAQNFGHLCRGRRIHTSGHSDLGILSNLGASSNFTRVYVDTASAACPSQSGNLAIASITFAAVVWGRRRALLSKDCVGSRVVFHNVTTEHDSVFVLFKFGS